MKRHLISQRSNWRSIIENQGFLFHTSEEGNYWDESSYYEFTASQVDTLEAATNELHRICLEAVQHVIDKRRYKELHIPNHAISLIEQSWNNETPAIYGRFDLSYNGNSAPKMLEYNADTPTSLLEAAVVQWHWMKDKFPHADQFNSIHERLVAKWTELKDYLNAGPLYFTGLDALEDYMNLMYMKSTAEEAGLEVKDIDISDIGWHHKDRQFVDNEMYDMTNVFKLYPWEWLLHEEFGQNIVDSFDKCLWIEPPWKLILSNKGILPILWELFPNHPNLLPSYFSDAKLKSYVKKPLYSREGANITIHSNGVNISTDGEYGEEGYVYQEYAPLPNFDGNYPVIGSWVIDGVSAGMGIRECNSLVTNNMSRFIPHIFR
jgi:glutathionylspermidine synthase